MPPIIVSVVQNATDVSTQDASVDSLILRIRSDEWREAIEKIRSEYQRATLREEKPKLAVATLKKRLPGILWSGRFTHRATSALVQHSGLIGTDLDEIGDRLPAVRATLSADPHLFSVFTSPTGSGLKAVFRVPPDATRHLASFMAVERHVEDLVGVKIDLLARIWHVSVLCRLIQKQH